MLAFSELQLIVRHYALNKAEICRALRCKIRKMFFCFFCKSKVRTLSRTLVFHLHHQMAKDKPNYELITQATVRQHTMRCAEGGSEKRETYCVRAASGPPSVAPPSAASRRTCRVTATRPQRCARLERKASPSQRKEGKRTPRAATAASLTTVAGPEARGRPGEVGARSVRNKGGKGRTQVARAHKRTNTKPVNKSIFV